MCTHLLCELIADGKCAIAIQRSHTCRPNITAPETSPAVIAEVRTLLPAIDAGDRPAAQRLAQLVRREALDDRSLLSHVVDAEPDLAPALERLLRRR